MRGFLTCLSQFRTQLTATRRAPSIDSEEARGGALITDTKISAAAIVSKVVICYRRERDESLTIAPAQYGAALAGDVAARIEESVAHSSDEVRSKEAVILCVRSKSGDAAFSSELFESLYKHFGQLSVRNPPEILITPRRFVGLREESAMTAAPPAETPIAIMRVGSASGRCAMKSRVAWRSSASAEMCPIVTGGPLYRVGRRFAGGSSCGSR
jgi:hypothetical protein